jgi:hypothetical protein
MKNNCDGCNQFFTTYNLVGCVANLVENCPCSNCLIKINF